MGHAGFAQEIWYLLRKMGTEALMEKGKERRCLIRYYIGWSRRQLLKLKVVTQIGPHRKMWRKSQSIWRQLKVSEYTLAEINRKSNT